MAISYFLVGTGKVITKSASYNKVTFKIAPKAQKGLAAAIDLFVMGLLPSILVLSMMIKWDVIIYFLTKKKIMIHQQIMMLH